MRDIKQINERMDSMLFCLFTIELYLDDVESRKESVRQNMELRS